MQVNDLAWGIYHDWPLMAGRGSERDTLNPAWPCETFSRQGQLGTPHSLPTPLGTSPATGSVRHRHQHALCIAVLASQLAYTPEKGRQGVAGLMCGLANEPCPGRPNEIWMLCIHKKWRSYEGTVRALGLSSAPDSGQLTPVFHPHAVCLGSLCCRLGMESHPTSPA